LTEIEFEKTIARYSRLMWNVASRVLRGAGNEQDIEECVADVFIDLWREPQSFDSSRGSLKTFLCLKCRSKAIDRFRRLTVHRMEELVNDLAADVPEPAAELAKKEDYKALREALGKLDETEKEILLRRFSMQQKPSQISKAMDIPLRKVENMIYRTKGKLRDELGGIYE
jgi:RNA polymerase sigma-70 factor (ECF subfamily)